MIIMVIMIISVDSKIYTQKPHEEEKERILMVLRATVRLNTKHRYVY